MDPASEYAQVCVTLGFATVAVTLRMIARRITKAGYSYDDALAVIAWVSGVGYSAVILTWIANYGLGRQIEDIRTNLSTTELIEKNYFLFWLSSLLYCLSLGFSKCTVLAFYWRIFKFSGIRIPIQVVSGLSIIWLIAQMFMVTLQCKPLRAFWDISQQATKCYIHTSTFLFGQVLTHVLLDISILILPIIQVAKMHLPLGQKISIITLFMFGTLTCVASILVLIQCLKFNAETTEVARDVALGSVWCALEINIAIVTSSLGLLQPIVRKLIPSAFSSLRHTQSQNASELSNARPVKLSTLVRNRELDESSSTHQLAGSEDGIFDLNSSQQERGRGLEKGISSPYSKDQHSGEADSRDGVYVRNEIAVIVEHV